MSHHHPLREQKKVEKKEMKIWTKRRKKEEILVNQERKSEESADPESFNLFVKACVRAFRVVQHYCALPSCIRAFLRLHLSAFGRSGVRATGDRALCVHVFVSS